MGPTPGRGAAASGFVQTSQLSHRHRAEQPGGGSNLAEVRARSDRPHDPAADFRGELGLFRHALGSQVTLTTVDQDQASDTDEPTPLWTPSELREATGGMWLGDIPSARWSPRMVSYDYRSAAEGALMVCVAPSTWRRPVDGSEHLAMFVARRAAGAIIQHDQTPNAQRIPDEFPLLLVKDTYRALRDLATTARARFQGTVVAITGTQGKTTSREMLLHIGERQGGASATRANNNAIPGVARTMAYCRREQRWAAIEMGFGPPLNGIRTSSEIVKPEVALITSIGRAHLDMFKPEELEEFGPERMVLSKKLQILDGMEPGGTAVFNRDMPHFDVAAEQAKKKGARLIGFGEHPEADSRLLNAELSAGGSKVRALIDGREIEYSLVVPGKHMVLNSIGVLTVVWAGGGDPVQAAHDLGSFEPVAGRSRVVDAPFRDGRIHLIDDSFNATPTSIESSLSLLQLAEVGESGRRVAALGEMGHLGEKEAEIHASLAPLFERYQVDRLFTWGPLMKHLHEAVPEERRGKHCETVPELYQAVREFLRPGDALTVKSGRGQGGLGDERFKRFIRAMKENAERTE